jgi:hypothetical protein
MAVSDLAGAVGAALKTSKSGTIKGAGEWLDRWADGKYVKI